MVCYITGHIQIINITFIGIISLKYEIINCLNLTRMGNLTKMGWLYSPYHCTLQRVVSGSGRRKGKRRNRGREQMSSSDLAIAD